MRKYLLLGVALVVLACLIQTEKGSWCHSFRFEPVIFPCNELGCLSGKSANLKRCQCGGVDLMRDLPCGGSHQCQCGVEPCACGKYCNKLQDPCTTAQECKLTTPQQRSPVEQPEQFGR
jgi:hypothetical protein